MVFLRGKDLWVAKLDGSGERQITTGSLGAGFAGYTRDAAGHIELYYTSEVALTGADSPSPATGAEFTVYRAALDGGPAEELFSFHGTMKHDELSATVASVSPDGTHIVYTDERGLGRFDLSTGQHVTLLTNAPCDEATVVSTCHGYYHPDWSPRGDLLLTMKLFYEGSQPLGVQPLDASGSPLEFGQPDEFDLAAWSASGQRLCLMPFNAHEAVQVTEASGNQLVDLEPALRAGQPIPADARVQGFRCAWAADGRLAMEYTLSTAPESGHIAIFDASLRYQTEVALPIVSEDPPNLAAWLPDGAGFFLLRWDVEHREPRVSVLMLDGAARELPFVANHVLAALP